jgi:hypothetical protein
VYNDDDAAQTRILTIAVVKTTLLLPVIHGSAYSHSHRDIYKTMQ